MNLDDYKTPETDAAIYPMDQIDVVWPDFARELERRLAACRDVLSDLERYPVARIYPDGPCIDSEDMKAIREVLALTGPQP